MSTTTQNRRMSGSRIDCAQERHERGQERDVEDDEERVAQQHAGDHTPEQLGMRDDQVGSGCDPMDHQCAEDHPENYARRNAKPE